MPGLAYAQPEEIGLDAARLRIAFDLLARRSGAGMKEEEFFSACPA
ncbi:MAG TPA: hypothetical protein VMV10_21285 [Pirellulales bacterium]|nr:hypothetical protein [Pirellulales bacterium]